MKEMRKRRIKKFVALLMGLVMTFVLPIATMASEGGEDYVPTPVEAVEVLDIQTQPEEVVPLPEPPPPEPPPTVESDVPVVVMEDEVADAAPPMRSDTSEAGNIEEDTPAPPTDELDDEEEEYEGIQALNACIDCTLCPGCGECTVLACNEDGCLDFRWDIFNGRGPISGQGYIEGNRAIFNHSLYWGGSIRLWSQHFYYGPNPPHIGGTDYRWANVPIITGIESATFIAAYDGLPRNAFDYFSTHLGRGLTAGNTASHFTINFGRWIPDLGTDVLPGYRNTNGIYGFPWTEMTLVVNTLCGPQTITIVNHFNPCQNCDFGCCDYCMWQVCEDCFYCGECIHCGECLDFRPDIFNNGPLGCYSRANEDLEAAEIIRVWKGFGPISPSPSTPGGNRSLPLSVANSITATVRGTDDCALDLGIISIGRLWVDGIGWLDYFTHIDADKSINWEFIDLTIVVRGEIHDIVLHNGNFVPPSFVIRATPDCDWDYYATITICNDGCNPTVSCADCDDCDPCTHCDAGHYGRHQRVYLGGTATGPVTWEIISDTGVPRDLPGDEFVILFNPGVWTPQGPAEALVIGVRGGYTICRDRTLVLEVTRGGLTTEVTVIMIACCEPCTDFCPGCDECFNCTVDPCPCGSGYCEECCAYKRVIVTKVWNNVPPQVYNAITDITFEVMSPIISEPRFYLISRGAFPDYWRSEIIYLQICHEDEEITYTFSERLVIGYTGNGTFDYVVTYREFWEFCEEERIWTVTMTNTYLPFIGPGNGGPGNGGPGNGCECIPCDYCTGNICEDCDCDDCIPCYCYYYYYGCECIPCDYCTGNLCEDCDCEDCIPCYCEDEYIPGGGGGANGCDCEECECDCEPCDCRECCTCDCCDKPCRRPTPPRRAPQTSDNGFNNALTAILGMILSIGAALLLLLSKKEEPQLAFATGTARRSYASGRTIQESVNSFSTDVTSSLRGGLLRINRSSSRGRKARRGVDRC